MTGKEKTYLKYIDSGDLVIKGVFRKEQFKVLKGSKMKFQYSLEKNKDKMLFLH